MLVRQSALYVLCVLAGIVGMLLTALLTRVLDPTSYGNYALAILIMSIGAALLFDWMGVALVRIYAGERKTEQTLLTFTQIYLVLAAVVLLSVPLAGFLIGADARSLAVYAAGPA